MLKFKNPSKEETFQLLIKQLEEFKITFTGLCYNFLFLRLLNFILLNSTFTLKNLIIMSQQLREHGQSQESLFLSVMQNGEKQAILLELFKVV